jgi:GntR family transcriptional regulator
MTKAEVMMFPTAVTSQLNPEPARPGSILASSSGRSPREYALPLYARIKRELQETITAGLRSGEIQAGAFFTTEKDVCRDFGVSAITAKRALDELEADGVLVRQRGRGTFVAQARIPQVLDHFYRLTEVMQGMGRESSRKVLRIGVGMPDSRVAEALGLRGRERVVEIERLYFVDGQPFLLQTSHLPVKLFPGMDKQDHAQVSLYTLMEQRYQLTPDRCSDSFEPVLLHKHDAHLLLAQPRMPGLRIERLTYSADRPVEFARGIIRGDRCRLTVHLS